MVPHFHDCFLGLAQRLNSRHGARGIGMTRELVNIRSKASKLPQQTDVRHLLDRRPALCAGPGGV